MLYHQRLLQIFYINNHFPYFLFLFAVTGAVDRILSAGVDLGVAFLSLVRSMLSFQIISLSGVLDVCWYLATN